jgi:predicted P-loop ATPase
MTASEVVKDYFAKNFQVVFWPAVGDQKGPKDKNWPRNPAKLADYREGDRVGILLGTELSPGRFAHDVDIDWAPGYQVAAAFLPRTEFIYGRASKKISHCIYALSEAIACVQYKDPVDSTMLLEIRGTKEDGSIGFQSMAPPSIWSKDGKQEPLEFRVHGTPTYFESVAHFRQRITLAAVGMLLAKRFGRNGFGHEVRLPWAGYLLRAAIPVEDVIAMGEAISIHCNNREISDVRLVVESTAAALAQGTKKVKGGPALAKLLGGDVGRKVISTLNNWLGRDSDFIRTPDGLIVKDNQENVRRAINLLGIELHYQEFAEKMLVSEEGKPQRPLDDRMLNATWLRIDREHRFRPSFLFFEKVITDAAYDNSFHPVRDYLHSLTWDGEPRINAWLATYGGAEDAADNSEVQTYLEAVSSIVLIAAVRRILHPGCKYDEMLVLESQQGLSKSSALRALCPRDEWFSDDLPLNVDAKEIIERTLGKWIIEASDLVGGRKADRDHLKSMLSRQVDGPARMAYARIPVERPRQFIIIGTTNSAEYLADATGARRFWPVKVGRFDVDGLVRDRDQLWAEAVVREASDESIRLKEELWSSAGEHQEQRRSVDAWEDALERCVEELDISPSGRVQVITDVLWNHLGIEVARRDLPSARRISEIMQRLGFERAKVRGDGKVQVGYIKVSAQDTLLPRIVKTKIETDM